MDYSKAIILKTDFAEAYYKRGILNLELKKNNFACKDWQKASSLGYTSADSLIQEHCK